LLEIHQPARTAAAGSASGGGTIKMVNGTIDIYSGGLGSTVKTETTETRVDSDSRVAVDVGEDDETRVATYTGSATVKNPQGEEMVISSREEVVANPQGNFSPKQTIPSPPIPIEPINREFDIVRHPVIELKWKTPDAEAVYLQVSRSNRFYPDQLDVDAISPGISGAHLQAVHPGTYYWRVASGTLERQVSEWSAHQRFQILTPGRRSALNDRIPPPLNNVQVQQLGNVIIIEGETEVGATVTINAEPVGLEANGSFRKTIELTTEGRNEIVIVATDSAGNKEDYRQTVYVEF
jgi:hypothetical protein